MKHHPEQLGDEIFLGNCADEVYKRIEWKSKRCGQVPYMRDGSLMSKYDAELLKPVFIKRSEVERKISGESSPLYKNILQRMLDRGCIALDTAA